MTGRGPGWQVRVFRLLVRAIYPRWFRLAHGDEMEEWLEARFARVRGCRATAALWIDVCDDAVRTAWILARRRRESRRQAAPVNRGKDMLWQDIRYAARYLARTPLFTLSAIALLAIALGTNVAVFAVVDRLLVRPLPYDRPEDVVFIYQDSDDGRPSSSAFPAYREIAATTGVFAAVTATSPEELRWERPDGSAVAAVEYTTASYRDVTGRAASRGRWLSREADRPGGPLEAVVSEATWRTQFGGDPSVVGRTIRLNGQAVTIVGVGPEGVAGSYPPVSTDFWLSISSTVLGGPYRVANLDLREDHWYDVRARLAPGISAAAAQDAMTALARAMGEAHPKIDKGRGLTVRRAADVQLYPETEGALLAAAGLAAMVLILGAANLTNLLLVRAMARSSEVAVRRAIGASALRIGRLYLTEALMLTLLGGLAGGLLALLALDALRSLPLPVPVTAAMALSIDGRVIGFAWLVTLATGLVMGVVPAWRSTVGDVSQALREDRRTVSPGPVTVGLRSVLVIVQIAGSLVLIVAGGLLARSLNAMLNVDPRVDATRVAFLDMSLGRGAGTTPQASLDEVLARVRTLPGVTHAAAASRLPASPSGTTTTIVEGYRPPVGTDAVELSFTIITPGYLDTVGLTLIEGRNFTDTDVTGAERVVLINEAAARRFWGSGSAIGRRLQSQSRPDLVRRVVGVVEDAPVSAFPERSTPAMFYVPSGQGVMQRPRVLVRTSGEAAPHVASIAAAAGGVRSTFEIHSQGTLESHLGASLTIPRSIVGVMSVVSVLALALAGLGIYAVVAFNVARRSAEFGIRIALGATGRQIVRMVLYETTVVVVIGVVCGLVAAALVLPPAVSSALFAVPALDPMAFAGAAVVLAAAAWAAAWWPARRAATTDAAIALRAT